MDGKDVYRIRKKHGWTQQQFSQLLGRSVAQISRYELDAINIPIKLIPLLHELEVNGHHVTASQHDGKTADDIRTELYAFIQNTSSKTALIRMLAFAKTITKEYPPE